MEYLLFFGGMVLGAIIGFLFAAGIGNGKIQDLNRENIQLEHEFALFKLNQGLDDVD